MSIEGSAFQELFKCGYESEGTRQKPETRDIQVNRQNMALRRVLGPKFGGMF